MTTMLMYENIKSIFIHERDREREGEREKERESRINREPQR